MANGLNSPMPPPIPTFEAPLSIPNTEVLPSQEVLEGPTTDLDTSVPEPQPEAPILPETSLQDGVSIMETAPESINVYREGEVDKVVVVSEAEQNVVSEEPSTAAPSVVETQESQATTKLGPALELEPVPSSESEMQPEEIATHAAVEGEAK